MQGLELQLGSIISVLPTIKTVIVRPLDSGGALVDIQLTSPTWDQYEPAPGMQLAYLEIGDLIRKPLMVFENDERSIRKGASALNVRDRQIQGGGGSYILLDSLGRISMTDGSMVNNLQLTDKAITGLALSTLLRTYGGLELSLGDAGELHLLKKKSFDATDVQLSITIKEDASLEIKNPKAIATLDADGKWTFSGSSIELLNASVQTPPGQVVTSGPTGTHAFDFTTGAPIIGSNTVKAAS